MASKPKTNPMTPQEAGRQRVKVIKEKIARGELPADYFKQHAQKGAATRKAQIESLKELQRQVTPSKI